MNRMSNLPHVKKPCRDCPFKKDALKGWLGRERITEILESDRFVCHKKRHLQCAGHMIISGMDNQFVRLATALGISLELTGHELIFNTKQECIDHHDHNQKA